VQCHANVEFSNAVCLLYELESENDRADRNDSDSDDDDDINSFGKKKTKEPSTVGCPVLKFQVVNEVCFYMKVLSCKCISSWSV
jgi:hypothetical protein